MGSGSNVLREERTLRGDSGVNPESEKLFEKAAHALHAADLLLKAGETDIAMGRAYYAMFYVAEALLRARDLRFGKHSAVHAAYGREYAKTGLLDPKFHGWMLDAFDRRIISDYDLEPLTAEGVVESAIGRAREFLQAARTFLEAPQA
jgi:uncharacterized protein (UPF0332 family)